MSRDAAAAEVKVSPARQKEFITSHADILDLRSKQTIRDLVMMEADGAGASDAGEKDMDIDLDACEGANPSLILIIYNIVRARLDALNQPAREGGLPLASLKDQ